MNFNVNKGVGSILVAHWVTGLVGRIGGLVDWIGGFVGRVVGLLVFSRVVLAVVRVVTRVGDVRLSGVLVSDVRVSGIRVSDGVGRVRGRGVFVRVAGVGDGHRIRVRRRVGGGRDYGSGRIRQDRCEEK